MPAAIAALHPRFARSAGAADAPAWRRHLRNALARMCDPYRPELHYMRGPGPKWRQKHGLGA
ncbi:hypothetical protein RA307_24660 [Xanthobacteraceae bacterium Astr-EGSB]|uniref:hypothetical protein n=1 Tax=Astrobacterium formosum TaxID=3069710 RepID=UPI0027B2FC0F|nr:hypothetical protein [Xanthobacteraceae bacterium Astr-EGSB]